MTPTPVLILVMLFLIYLALLVTIGLMTLRKGHLVLAIVGLFFPPLWLVGAMLPPKRKPQPVASSHRHNSHNSHDNHHKRRHK